MCSADCAISGKCSVETHVVLDYCRLWQCHCIPVCAHVRNSVPIEDDRT